MVEKNNIKSQNPMNMYHLSRKFIDEKVMQQYYFEKFMNGSKKTRKALLPGNGNYSKYEKQNETKILHPEVKIAEGFTVDFVLYPMDQSEFVYIELKFKLSKLNTLNAKRVRHPLLKPGNTNGRPSRGFAVVFNNDADDWPDDIDVVILDWGDFARWYVLNSPKLVDQLIHKISPDTERFRNHPPRNWLVYIGKGANEHYNEGALKGGKWAFKDRKRPGDLMDIEQGDRILFVQAKDIYPDRKAIPFEEKRDDVLTISNPKSPRHGEKIDPKTARFTVTRIDAFEIKKVYFLNFDSDTFETEEWSNNQGYANEIDRYAKKRYTQFITFNVDSDSASSYIWNRGTKRKIYT